MNDPEARESSERTFLLSRKLSEHRVLVDFFAESLVKLNPAQIFASPSLRWNLACRMDVTLAFSETRHFRSPQPCPHFRFFQRSDFCSVDAFGGFSVVEVFAEVLVVTNFGELSLCLSGGILATSLAHPGFSRCRFLKHFRLRGSPLGAKRYWCSLLARQWLGCPDNRLEPASNGLGVQAVLQPLAPKLDLVAVRSALIAPDEPHERETEAALCKDSGSQCLPTFVAQVLP